MTQFVTAERNQFTGQVEAKMLNLTPLTRGLDAALVTVDMAYQYVPWFRRACKLRANAIGRFPLALENEAGDDVSELPEYQAVMGWTRSLLYHLEMSMVKYGASYHLLESNRRGANITPRFIPTGSVIVRSNMADGVTGFYINGIGEIPLAAGKVVWVWEPSDTSETEPGPSDGQAALKSSGLLYAIDEMANRYMGSGGVPVTAVYVSPTAQPGEREKTENFLTRLAGGFRNAFKFLVVSKGTEFSQIGSELKDIGAVDLTASQRDNVAVAIGVPPTVIDGKSANYATAESEMTGFYMNTVIPQAEQYEPQLNTQLFQRLGLTLRFKPDELEVMQSLQLQQAQAVKELTGGKQILSVNEARAIIEYEDIGPRGEWQDEPTVTAPPRFGAQTPSASAPALAEANDLAEVPDDERMKDWLRTSLARIKAGSIPIAGTPFDDELSSASSGNAVRRIYETHWPRKARHAPVAPTMHKRAIAALEEYNALARKMGA